MPSRSVTGDPFDEPSRPLIISLASDCRELPTATYRDLVALCRYPGVEVALAPELDDLGFGDVLRFEWSEEPNRVSVLQSASADRRAGDLFSRLDGPASTHLRRAADHAFLFSDPGLDERAARIFQGPPEVVARLAREAVAHQALGNDYIVSPLLTQAREIREAAWPNEFGACTVDEAFALAGLKSRMYRSLPMAADAAGTVWENVGAVRDLAVMRSSRRLARAIGGALGPKAETDELSCSDHLLAIRNRLAEIFVARDEVDRLSRREALGPTWSRPFDVAPVSGTLGNDTTSLMAYHANAALNAAYAIAENLAWVTIRRSGTTLDDKDRSVALTALVAPSRQRPRWWSDAVQASALSLSHAPGIPLELALLRLRNAFAHRHGVDYGAISLEPRSMSQPNEYSGLWFQKGVVGTVRLLDRDIADLFEATRNSATLYDPEMAVFTFGRLLDTVLASSLATTDSCLAMFAWSPRAWLFAPEAREESILRPLWRGRLHRRLFAIGRLAPILDELSRPPGELDRVRISPA